MHTAILARTQHTGLHSTPAFAVAARDSRLRPAHVFSTASVVPARQFEAWQAQCGPVIELVARRGEAAKGSMPTISTRLFQLMAR